MIRPTEERAQWDTEQIAAATGLALEKVTEAFKHMAVQFQGLYFQAFQQRLPGPEDPRARAIWANQHCGTGPATPRNWAKR